MKLNVNDTKILSSAWQRKKQWNSSYRKKFETISEWMNFFSCRIWLWPDRYHQTLTTQSHFCSSLLIQLIEVLGNTKQDSCGCDESSLMIKISDQNLKIKELVSLFEKNKRKEKQNKFCNLIILMEFGFVQIWKKNCFWG